MKNIIQFLVLALFMGVSVMLKGQPFTVCTSSSNEGTTISITSGGYGPFTGPSSITLLATNPNPNLIFNNWVANGSNIGNTNPLTYNFTPTEDISIVANYFESNVVPVQFPIGGIPTVLNRFTTTNPTTFNTGQFTTFNANYLDRLILGDPNGATGLPANVANFTNANFPWVPTIGSMLQSYGGIVTNTADSRSGITSMIEQQGVGIALGNVATAGWQGTTQNSTYGVQGEFSYDLSPTNPGTLNTAGGFFRNTLANNLTNLLPDFPSPTGRLLNQSNAGVTGVIVNNQEEGSVTNRFASATLGIDETPLNNVNDNWTNPNFSQRNNSSEYVGLNYAGLFLGRGYFSSRVGIGWLTTRNYVTGNIFQADDVISAAFNPTHMLHIDGSSLTGLNEGNVLRLVGLKEKKAKILTIDLELGDQDDEYKYGSVHYMDIEDIGVPKICDIEHNVNHGKGTGTNELICGKIWDDNTNPASLVLGHIGINTPSTQAFSIHTGINIKTLGHVEMEGLSSGLTVRKYLAIDANNEVFETDISIPPIPVICTNPNFIAKGDPANPGQQKCSEIYENDASKNVGIGFGVSGPTGSNPTDKLHIVGASTGVNLGKVLRLDNLTNVLNDRYLVIDANNSVHWRNLPTNPGNNCNWTINGNGNNATHSNSTTAVPRGTIVLNATCSTNNFIGTRADNAPAVGSTLPDANDLVFGTLDRGWMRLTTGGALFLTDKTTATTGNIRIGMFTGDNMTTGSANNIIIGQNALSTSVNNLPNQHHLNNIIIGTNAAKNLCGGSSNIFMGSSSGLDAGQIGGVYDGGQGVYYNVCVGTNTGQKLKSNHNTFVGYQAGQNTQINSATGHNTFIGSEAGLNNISGVYNTYIGAFTGRTSTSSRNVIVGNYSGNGTANLAGNENTIMGVDAGANSIGADNVFMGYYAGFHNTEGNNNTFVGPSAGSSNNSRYSQNVYMGYRAGPENLNAGGNNNICIGNRPRVNGIQNSVIAIGDSAIVGGQTASYGIAVGCSTQVYGESGIAIGKESVANHKYDVAIGYMAATGPDNTGGPQYATKNTDRIVLGRPLQTISSTYPTNPRVGIAMKNPTTRFHVDCKHFLNYIDIQLDGLGNPVNNQPPLSAIRFEDLQLSPCLLPGAPASGSYVVSNLVIGQDGYVFRGSPVCSTNIVERISDPLIDTKTDSLQKQIDELKALIATMQKDLDKCCEKPGTNPIQDFPINNEIRLYQNVPNPFTEGTEIKFFVPATVKQAALLIYDLNGREIRKIDINERNESIVKIHGKELAAGMYIYTLIADNKEVDSKRMILTGN